MNKNLENIYSVLGNSNFWALTGSQALKIHNIQKSLQYRQPKDINIAVSKNSHGYIKQALKSLGWNVNNAGKYHTVFRKGNKKLNVFLENSPLAPKLVKTIKYNKYPRVYNIQSLYNKKRAIRSNENFNLERNENKKKTINNMRHIEMYYLKI